MDVTAVNEALIHGKWQSKGVLPHLEALDEAKFRFAFNFGLSSLPLEPGIIMIRGPRQYGKSTWMEQSIASTIESYGPGSALYLNGDELIDMQALIEEARKLLKLFHPKTQIKRLFIDEITAVTKWEQGLKILADRGELKGVLVITTGSKASDLRRGVERLPGRKGKLERTDYIFTPIAYHEFREKCGVHLGEDTLLSYLLAGGSPMACNEVATRGRLPEFIPGIVEDWILGEFAASGRSRSNLMSVLEVLFRFAMNPVGQAKLARESGLSNNTTAQGYIDLLQDLLCVVPSFALDTSTQRAIRRKPCKFHFVNLLAAMSWHPKRPRSIEELKNLNSDLGPIWEWAVAQELFRRTCIDDAKGLDEFYFWQGADREVDFVTNSNQFIEVKVGAANPLHFSWFLQKHPRKQLTIINKERFATEFMQGITLEDFLLEKDL